MVQPVILAYDTKDTVNVPITSTSVITKGDLVDISNSGYAYIVDAAADDATFGGIAVDTSATGDTDDIVVAHKCVVEIDATSGSYQVPAGLLYVSTNAVEDDAGANTIGWVYRQDTAATRIEMLVDVQVLKKRFENNT